MNQKGNSMKRGKTTIVKLTKEEYLDKLLADMAGTVEMRETMRQMLGEYLATKQAHEYIVYNVNDDNDTEVYCYER